MTSSPSAPKYIAFVDSIQNKELHGLGSGSPSSSSDPYIPVRARLARPLARALNLDVARSIAEFVDPAPKRPLPTAAQATRASDEAWRRGLSGFLSAKIHEAAAAGLREVTISAVAMREDLEAAGIRHGSEFLLCDERRALDKETELSDREFVGHHSLQYRTKAKEVLKKLGYKVDDIDELGDWPAYEEIGLRISWK